MRRRVVILGLPPVDALDVIGPAEVITMANRLHGAKPSPYVLELISTGADAILESESGIGLKAHKTLDQERHASRPIDTLIVASGFDPVGALDPAVTEWIRMRSRSVRRVCSICVGAFALADAGLLDGRRATTHWGMARPCRALSESLGGPEPHLGEGRKRVYLSRHLGWN
jgi:transcriptional regulator GlxA family with amidase domain